VTPGPRRVRLIIVDAAGYRWFEPEAANLCFQLASSRDERASLILTSAWPFSCWGSVFGDLRSAMGLQPPRVMPGAVTVAEPSRSQEGVALVLVQEEWTGGGGGCHLRSPSEGVRSWPLTVGFPALPRLVALASDGVVQPCHGGGPVRHLELSVDVVEVCSDGSLG
jgi:IstB-like ATP binding protein